MKQINDRMYLTADETARYLDMSADELTTFTLETSRAEFILDGIKVMYCASDVELCARQFSNVRC